MYTRTDTQLLHVQINSELFRWCWMWSSQARPVLPRASLASPARWHMVHSIHVSRHTVYWVQAQVGFGRVYFPGPNRVGARAHFMRWAQPILRLSRRACARANDGLASVNAGQPLMKNLSHFVKSVLYVRIYVFFIPFLLAQNEASSCFEQYSF